MRILPTTHVPRMLPSAHVPSLSGMAPNMGGLTHVQGVDKVVANLRIAGRKIADRISAGLYKAGLYLQRESQLIVPVQLGNLKASAYTRKLGSGERTDVIVGYTASYAVFVHENPKAAHGKEFNVKHAQEIARAGSMTRSKKTGKEKWKPASMMGTAQGGMFPRGENQQYKFLETPARTKRDIICAIIVAEAGRP